MSDAPNFQLFVFMLRQDDPHKCTAARLVRFGLAKAIYRIRQIPQEAVILNPMAESIITPRDGQVHPKLVAIDCSWEKAETELTCRLPGYAKRLPTLLAANPTNYAKLHKLSTVEALAAASYILGFRDTAHRILSKFKWGENFLTLNKELLEAYSAVSSEDEYSAVENQFF